MQKQNINAWQEYIWTITYYKKRTRQERKRKMSIKKDKLQPNEPEIKIVRRNSINSGRPNCEYL